MSSKAFGTSAVSGKSRLPCPAANMITRTILESDKSVRLSVVSFASDSPKVNESPRVSFTLAHLSDVHLPHTRKRNVLSNFSGKRIVGGFSWFFRRRSIHRLEVANAVQDSIIAAKPDHVALTGDLVNIAAWSEFPEAARWVKRFGGPERLTFVPGNHDAYVNVPWEKGLNNFADWMRPDRHETSAPDTLFPIVRMRRNIALIGLNSGSPQKYHLASGALGERQLRDLRHVLGLLGQQGFYRVVLIHHPPLPGLAIPRKALKDASELQNVLQAEGCELVLHGHNHHAMLNWLETKSGPTPVVGAPSASLAGDKNHEPGGWTQFHIRRHKGFWQAEMTRHVWNNVAKQVEAQSTTLLTPP
jgi:3',5'-cyclic AMP phosphodiesterase CpdA